MGDAFSAGTRDANGPHPLSEYGDLATTAPASCRKLQAYSLTDL